MISFGRLLAGLILPIAILLCVWIPAPVLVRAVPVDWKLRHQRTLAESRGEGVEMMALANSFRTVPAEERALAAPRRGGCSSGLDARLPASGSRRVSTLEELR